MGLLSNRIERSNLKPGDHIYSWRTAYIYAHHGIYVGDDKVIHFTRHGQEVGSGTVLDLLLVSSAPNHSHVPCPTCAPTGEAHGVVSSCLNCFLAGGILYRFEYAVNRALFLGKARGGTCTLAASDPDDIVVHRAKYLLENGFGCYNVFKNNCEDFAIYCKTGLVVLDQSTMGHSGQAASIIGGPLVVVLSTAMSLVTGNVYRMVVTAAGAYCASRYATDVGMRRDVLKVPAEDLATRLAAGIHVGDDEVIHFTKHGKEVGTGTALDLPLVSSGPSRSHVPCPTCGPTEEPHEVASLCLNCFLASDISYRFKFAVNLALFLAKACGETCLLAASDADDIVVQRAKYLLEHGLGCYIVFKNNREEFAIYCKIGLLVLDLITMGQSGQAASIRDGPLADVLSKPLRLNTTNVCGMIFIAVGVYFASRYAADIGMRRDVVKAFVKDLARMLQVLEQSLPP